MGDVVGDSHIWNGTMANSSVGVAGPSRGKRGRMQVDNAGRGYGAVYLCGGHQASVGGHGNLLPVKLAVRAT